MGCAAGAAEHLLLEVTAVLVSSTPAEDRWGWGSDAATALLSTNEFTSSPVTVGADADNGDVLEFCKIRGANSSSREDAVIGDTLLLTARAVYRCTYGAGEFVDTTANLALVFTFNGVDWDASTPPA